MDFQLKQGQYVSILWSPIGHRWTDIINQISGLGITLIQCVQYEPICENEKQWHKFIIDCYLSHEKVDSPSVNIVSKMEKIKKKIHLEHLDRYEKKICALVFEFADPEFLEKTIYKELKDIWDYTEQRIRNNKVGLLERGYSSYLNITKDIIRKRFYDDKDLLPYYKGAFAGRKRIIHTPQSHSGCQALLNFLESFSHNIGKDFLLEDNND